MHMYMQGNVAVDGSVKITPVMHFDVPEWMEKLSSLVSTVRLSSVKIGKEYSKRPVGAMCSCSWKHLVTKDGRFASCVGYKDWRQNSVKWRRLLHLRFDPNDTIETALLCLGEDAKDVAWLCEESVNGYGETHYSFFSFEKV